MMNKYESNSKNSHNRIKYLLDVYINQGDERSHFPYELALLMSCNREMLDICEKYDYNYKYKRFNYETTNYEYIDYDEEDFIDYDDLINLEDLCCEDENNIFDDMDESEWTTVDHTKSNTCELE